MAEDEKKIGWKGLTAAGAVIASWTAMLAFLFTRDLQWADATWAIPAMILQTFLQTGLFITAHDAMHGTVFPRNRRVNDIIGEIAVRLYALFSYQKLRQKHGEHHRSPGKPDHDPDFHDGEHSGFLSWYLHFVGNYVGIWQIVGMAIVFNVLEHLVGVPAQNLIVFWVAPALLSTVQLFYFGTYLPHREPVDEDDPHHSQSNDFAPWLSFLTCYHFGYHREHHEDPHIPWWRLPKQRAHPSGASE